MCGGFYCTKRALIGLNLIYMLVGCILVAVATYGRTSSIITSVSILSGVVLCGVVLLLVSVLGVAATRRHHQVQLFFYMLVLVLLFIVQFAVACACLAVNERQQRHLAERGWQMADNSTKSEAQTAFGCCGFDTTNNTAIDADMKHPACPARCCAAGSSQCCMADDQQCKCDPCYKMLKNSINDAVRAGGGIGLFFSFTELIGFVMTYRYRNMMNPDRGTAIN